MKKWCFFLLAVFSFGCVQGADFEREESICAKVSLQNQKGYFVLADGSCWKAMSFVPRWRSISEWWNSVEIVPQNYQCEPADWTLGTEIQAYSKYGNIEVNLADASNQEALNQCTHLLFNKRTGQVLFAIAMDTAHCMSDLFNEAYKEGKAKGVQEGYAKARSDSNVIYENGRIVGYKTGYAEGYKAAMNGDGFEQ